MSLWCALGKAGDVDMLQTMLEVWSQAGVRRQYRETSPPFSQGPFRSRLLYSVRN